MVFIYGMFALITNIIGMEAVISEICSNNLYCRIKAWVSDENKNYQFNEIQSWLGLTFCILWIFGIRILKFVGKEKNKVIDAKL